MTTTSQKIRSFLVAAAVSYCFVPTARSAEFAWRPISASGSHTLNGNEIILDGGGQRVLLELKLSGWGAAADLSTWQATLEPAPLGQVCVGGGNDGNPCFTDVHCYGGGVCVPTRPGPIGPALEACAANGDCTAAFSEAGAKCNTMAHVCFAGWQNLNRADFVIQGGFPAVDTSTPKYRFGSQVVFGDPAVDDGSIFYGGHLVLDVPLNANGFYTLGFLTGADSFMLTTAGEIPFDITPGIITVQCTSNLHCDDLNECTDDVCQGNGMCSYAPNYNQATMCCNPLTGATTSLSDGNVCTQDVCEADGTVSHPPEPQFTSCGSQTTTDCNKPDSCDGAGTCLPRLEPAGTACGSQIDTECDDPNTCDGAGVCQSNYEPPGTACGSQSDTQCDNPDTCSGAGVCRQNNEPNGTTCDDLLYCTVNEACQGGNCSGGGPRNCSDGLSCTTDTCDEVLDICVSTLDPGNCLITGTCHAPGAINPGDDCEECNPAANTYVWTDRSDGSECDDGDSCTGTGRPGIGVDTCTVGVCAGTTDPECNDDCAQAQVATVGLNTATNHNGGPDSDEASCQLNSNNDVWFVYTADCDAPLLMDTAGSVLLPSNDPVLSVYTECGGVEIACDDNSGPSLHASLSFDATLGEDYYIRVGGVGNNNGVFVLNITRYDDCRIGTGCYATGDLDPANDCMACNPASSTTDWSPVSIGTACGTDTEDDCDWPDSCDGAGVCLSNPKPDGTQCLADGNGCTQNLCESGVCSHPPQPVGVACGDPGDTECDNPNTCNGSGVCLQNFEPGGLPCGDSAADQCDNADSCDGGGACLLNHVPDDTECDDGLPETGFDACQAGVCVGIPLAEPPTVQALGMLAFTVTPQPPGLGAPVALHLRSPDWPCLDLYVQADGTLGPVAFEQLVDDWDTIIVTGPKIVPSSEYLVEAEIGTFSTTPGSGTTYLWGDHDASGGVDFRDIALSVRYFTWEVIAPIEQMDIAPCPPDGSANLKDIAATVNAFVGWPYPCSLPCP